MDIQKLLTDVVLDPTMRSVTLGSTLLGVISGAIGTYAVLRRQSLLGDTISHAAFPGVILAFLLTGSRSPAYLILGAGLIGWLSTLLVLTLVRRTRVKTDSALGIGLSMFFGLGIVLLSHVQNINIRNKAGLDKILFGQAAALLHEDIIAMFVLGGVILILLALFWKEFKLVSFDPEFAHSLGLRVRLLDGLLVSALVLAIVMGLQTVGVVLMSAMIVAPAAAARQWTERLGRVVALAGLFGALSGTLGVALSRIWNIPPGPAVVLFATSIVVVSLFLAPSRGILWKALRQIGFRKKIQLDTILYNFYALSQHHDNPQHPHTMGTLRALNANPITLRRSLNELEKLGLVQRGFALTQKGLDQARNFDRRED